MLVAPGIIVVDKDSSSTGGIFQDFRTARNIALQTVIPGHHQSLGATERRSGHFRMITDHTIWNKKSEFLMGKRAGWIFCYGYDAP